MKLRHYHSFPCCIFRIVYSNLADIDGRKHRLPLSRTFSNRLWINQGFGMVRHSRNSKPKPPVPSKRKRRAAQVVSDAILKAAEVLTRLDGDCNFTLDQIARLVRLSPASIYDHFRSKGALVEAVRLRLEAKAWRRRSARAPASPT